MVSEGTFIQGSVQLPVGFPRLPSNWRWERLGLLCKGIYDCPHSTPVLTGAGPYLVRTQDFPDGVLKIEEMAHVSRETYLGRIARAAPEGGDILYSREGSYHGIAAEVPEGHEICMGQRMVLIRPDCTVINFRFLRYWLNSTFVRSYIAGMREGSGAPRINLPTIRNMLIPAPSMSEQNSIAGILGGLDDKIAVNERIVSTTRQLGLAMFVESLLQGDPDEVDVLSVSSVITRGVAPNYSESSDELLVLNQKCIRDGRVSLAPARRTLRGKVKEPKLLRRDDVLVNSTGVGTLGRVARWTSDEAATADSHVTIVRFNPARVDPVCAGFAMLRAQPYIEAMGEGSTGQTELRRNHLGALGLVLPSAERQLRLGPKLDLLEHRANQATEESRTLAALRDTLLPQLMSGRLRVKEAEKMVEDHT